MDVTADFKSYQERITSSLVSVTRTASQISSQDIGFHRSSSDRFSQSLDAQSTHLLRLTNKLLKAASKDTSLKPPNLQDRDDIEDNWRSVVDIVDDLLEKADRSLDEFTGVIKRLSPARQDGTETPTKKPRTGQGLEQWSHSSLPKPQLLFLQKVNNHETGIWKPLLATKPHANMPLEDSIGNGQGGFKHPYAHEIQHMIYPAAVYQISEPMPFSPPEESEPIFVDTQEGVQEMLDELKQAKEIAIDLEHHDKHSYIGLVSLMQISTRNKDWIVDTLKPWRESLQVLNEVFANPRIVKVLHGSTSDIIWLQRDLGLYIVGLFDTYHASNALQFPAKSLKYLLQKFADFEAQKQYQLADWRVRPLPQELIDYARSDTHFLLYIYDNLKNMLLELSTSHDNLIERVLDASRREALQVYERPIYDSESGLNPGGWMRLLLQRTSQLTSEQLGVFRAIHAWRDQKARELDEGDQNLIPNTYVWTIAELMPTYRGAFHQRGVGRLPRYVAENIPEIIEVVKQGMAVGKNGPSVQELIDKYGDRAGPMFGRNKFIRRHRPEEPNRGLGATVQLLNNSGELPVTPPVSRDVEIADEAPVEPIISRALSSRLWGPVEPLKSSSTNSHEIAAQALSNILPLQNIFQNSFAISSTDILDNGQGLPTKAIPAVNGTPQSQEKRDDVFIVKEHSRKRKASDALESEKDDLSPMMKQTAADDQPLDLSSVPLNIEFDTKRQSKQARKAEKRAKKLAESQERATAQANMVPFDYASAESVLHAKTQPEQTSSNLGGKQNKDKPLNPFARAMDTSTGARRNRMGKEMPGRSQTFRN